MGCQLMYHLHHWIEVQNEEWIPAHCDIGGNEHADFLAKKGALVIQRPTKISTFNPIRNFSNMAFKYNFKMEEVAEMSKDKNWATVSSTNRTLFSL
ncbi:hypothetical protein TNCV_1844691 [Trichonephila clavipes]|nr:hypothetical protein TNCV_1844691 [Trichonephila clavipes]